ncbi:hypothetical protein BGW80DRAFT_1341631 [Lactifluus volemus]|nr:hypothetical protein BGW80DRAFT_1341631 [Lactifluus volemus]
MILRNESAYIPIPLVLHSVGDRSSNLSVPKLRKGWIALHRHDRASRQRSPSHFCRGLPLSKTWRGSDLAVTSSMLVTVGHPRCSSCRSTVWKSTAKSPSPSWL